MSANKHDNMKKAAAYAFSAVCGAITSGVMILLFSWLMYALGLPPRSAGALSVLSFAAGCAICGFVCGSIKRRGGLRIGVICAGIMFACILAGSLLFGEANGGAIFLKLITALFASCIGSVCAVNRRRD